MARETLRRDANKLLPFLPFPSFPSFSFLSSFQERQSPGGIQSSRKRMTEGHDPYVSLRNRNFR